jgi:hypothetical protein
LRSSAGPGPAELIPLNGQGGLGTQLQNNGTVPTKLAQLTDVTLGSITNKQVLRYDSASGKWLNATEHLSDLSDVNTTGLTTGQLLQFNGTSWVPHTPLLSEDGDVTISSPANLQVLQYNSGTGKWANATISVSATLAGLTDVQLTSLADGNILQYNAASSKWKNVSIASATQICLQVSLQANQTAAANNTDTVVQYTLPTTDTQSAWSNTLFKWTPTVAGLYMVLCNQVVDTISGNFGAIAIRKNGTILAKDTALSGAASTIGLEVMLPISMNGTTDFIDIVAQGSNAGGNPVFYSVSPRPNLTILQFGVSAGGGSSTLAGDTDVAITTPATGQILVYNSVTSKWENKAKESRFLLEWNSTAQAGSTVNAPFWAGMQGMIPAGFTVTHVCFYATAAAATSHVTPALYSVNANGTLNTLVASGSTVVGVTQGLNELPLTTPYVMPADGPLAYGMDITVAGVSMGVKGSTLAMFFSITVDAPLTTPATTTFASQTWAGWFVKGHN